MLAGPVYAESAISPEQLQFFTKSKNAILIDGRTGKSMYEKNPDELIAPASMSKIMTQIMVFERLAERRSASIRSFLSARTPGRKAARNPAVQPCILNRNRG